ncbi:hypothetical protein [Pseudomonas lactis]|uniref:hypothetical protein n=1 Tax=Pseudomonas lactis TaxID=1615674 RepID=UPI000647FCEB|nr:hypothetical protein [Pseudomonas lactis]
MTDYTELKRLAEAFPADLDWDSNTEPFFNGPSGESLGGGSTGFYCVYGAPFEIDGEQYDGHTYVETCKADFAKFMVAARDGVLALIAENERDELALRAFSRVAENAVAERDQLRAEVAGLKTGYEAYERVNAELKAEVEKLRKELAARHPFKFAQESPAIGFTGCVICGVYTDHGGLPCPKTRATAIAHAAMGKGEQS